MKGRVKEQKGIEYYMQLPYSILLHEIEDDDERYWIAEVTELPGCESHGSSVEEAIRSVEEAKKDWILDSLEEGQEVPVPVDRDKYKGKILTRMSRSLHRSLSLMAEAENLSLNQLIVTILAKEVGRLSVLNRTEQKVDDLLNKISDIIEKGKEPCPILFSASTQFHGANNYFLLNTTFDIDAKDDVGTSVLLHGAVGTAAPLEELQYCSSVQSSKWAQFVLSDVKTEEEKKAVETNRK